MGTVWATSVWATGVWADGVWGDASPITYSLARRALLGVGS
jgi:hypothetical protein